MKNLKRSNFLVSLLISSLLTFGLILLTNIAVHGQKNSISIAPINPAFGSVNIGYERVFNNEWSVAFNFQRIFKEKEREVFHFWGQNSEYTEMIKGVKPSIELRKYFSLKKRKTNKRYALLGLNACAGDYHLKRGGSRFNEVHVTSYGFGVHFGYKVIHKSNIFINLELIGHLNWIAQGESEFILYREAVKSQGFGRMIEGVSMGPRFSIGYAF